MSSKRKRLGLGIICIIIGSLLGYSIGVYSNGGNPTIDGSPGKGIWNFDWLNSSVGVNSPEFYRNGQNYTEYIEGLAGGGVTDHGALTGLDEDDHALYLLQDGSEGLTGDWDIGDYNLTGEYLWADEFYKTGIGNYTAWIESLEGGGITGLVGATAFVGFNESLAFMENYFLCDGTSDNVQIEDAADYVDALGGGNAFLETGLYDITAFVDFVNLTNVRVTGSQWDAVELRATAAISHIFRMTDGTYASGSLTFENIYFNGNGNADSLVGVVEPNSCTSLVVEHCRFGYALDLAIHNGNPTEVSGCVFVANGNGDADAAINIDGGYAWRVHDCIFSGNYVSIMVEGASVAMIDNCQFYLDTIYSILIVAGSSETKINNIVIRGDDTTVTGIEDNGIGTVIQGFHIYNCATRGIMAQGTHFTISDGFINGNSLNTFWGIHVVGADLDGKITGVTIRECVAAVASDGSTYVLVDGCVLTDNTHALNFWDTGIDYWTFGDNDFHGNTNGVCNNVALIGVNCRLPTHTIPLTQGTTFISTADEAWGWEIDADTDFALGIGWLPVKVQQVVRIRVIGVALAAPGVGDYMRIQITGEGGTFGEDFATNPIDVVDKNNEEVAIAIDEVTQWIFTVADDAQIGTLLGGDRLQLKILHEGAGNGDAETNAMLDSMLVEYL